MRVSEERIDALSEAIVDRLAEDELVDLTIDEDQLAETVAMVIKHDLAKEDEIQREAVEWVQRHKSRLIEGTSEWSIEVDRKRQDLAIAHGYVLP